MKKVLALLFFLLHIHHLWACSTFLLNKNGQLVFGRNYDWVTGNGMVMVNARNVKKTSFAPENEKTITWISSCGSITFNQFGKEFPHGGMNEKGLVVELMWLNGTSYPEADDRPALNELQWIQYQLDNFATVDEVLANQSKIRIGRQGVAPLHYLIADASGNAATIEFIQGKTVIHTGKDLKTPVLTNTIYADALKQYESKGRGYDNSNERFAIACKMTKEFQQAKNTQQPVAFAFEVLDKIAQGNYTKWRIVYDITDRKIHFIANGNQRKMISFNAYKFDCSENALAYHLNTKDNDSSITFKPLHFDANRKLIETSARESSNQLDIPFLMIAGAAQYFNEVQCAQ